MNALKRLIEPRTVAVIGASNRPGALGYRVMANLHRGEFGGAVLPVHPRHPSVLRIHAYPTAGDLPVVPDLAIICAPATAVADQMRQLGERGVRAAIVMSGDPEGNRTDTALKRQLDDIAAHYGIRWLGPRAAGVQLPRAGLNASWFDDMPPPGRLALVSQSASLAASVVSWATARGIGFSSIVALGDGGNVDEADLLDHLAGDGRTQSVLVCMHRVSDGRKFMASARAIARLKPVAVLWADAVTATPGGELPVCDPNFVCKAAFRRSGLLRVDHLGEWFDAVEMLAYGRRQVGERLGIVSNGMGPALLMRNALARRHPLASLEGAAGERLATLLPRGIAAGNPLDLGVNAGPAHYESALRAMLESEVADALMVIVTPCSRSATVEIAEAIGRVAKASGRTVMVCWPGGGADDRVRGILAAAEVSIFGTPELAINAYLHMVRFRRSQESLRQVPEPCTFAPARTSIGHDLELSDDSESIEYLRAYGAISSAILDDRACISGHGAAHVLAAVGIGSPADDPATAATRSTVVPLRIVVGDDAAFGRAIEASVGSRRWTLLPALNAELSAPPAAALGEELALLGLGFVPTAVIARTLFRIADLLVGFPEIVAGEIPSFQWTGTDLAALDSRWWVRAHERGAMHLAIHPYPREAEQKIRLRDGTEALVRPVRPDEDIPLLEDLLGQVSADDRFLRFCKVVRGIPPDLLAKLARVDYDRDMAFVALRADADGRPRALGMVDAFVSPDHHEAEFSIMLRSDLKGTGLGKALMLTILAYCRQRRIGTVLGLVLKENAGMRGLATHLGFTTRSDPDDDMVTVSIKLATDRNPADACMASPATA